MVLQILGGTMSRKKLQEFYSETDQLFDKQAFIESIKERFKEIEDPRAVDNQSYPIAHLLVMIVCATLAGANSIVAIHAYAELKLAMFASLLGIERAPSYNVFWWLLTRLSPQQFESCLIRWIQALPEEDRERLIAIDGKRLNGASRNQKIHLVAAWESLRSLFLGQIKASEKSNEITAIPELLESIDIKDATITIDAAGCQTKIVEKIREGDGHYFIALKGNQGHLQAEAENFFTQARAADYEETGCQIISTCEKGHGRIEERQVVVTNDLDWLDCQGEWKDLTSLTEVCRRTINGQTTESKRFFISDLVLGPEKAGALARSHWLIENHLHWNMDVNFDEDSTLASIGHAPENLAILKRIASTLIRMDLGGVRSTAKRRRQAMWDDSWTLRLLSRIFEMKL
jgi:predicted transposase YbfD/YdcC